MKFRGVCFIAQPLFGREPLRYGNKRQGGYQNAVTRAATLAAEKACDQGLGRLTEAWQSPLLPWSAGRMAASLQVSRSGGEESPGSMEARCRITSGGGDPRDSATESKPPRDTGDGVAG